MNPKIERKKNELPTNVSSTVNMFYLRMTGEEWKKLDSVAVHNGKKNARRFLRAELYRFRDLNKDAPMITVAPKKIKNNFDLPPDLVPFYESMATRHATTVNQIVYRFIILPHMIQYDLHIARTTMQAPVYSSSSTPQSTYATSSVTTPPSFKK